MSVDAGKLVIRRKRKTKSASAVLLEDCVKPYVTSATEQKLNFFGWETLENPAYSPDLSSLDFHLSGSLKEALGKRRFDDDPAVEAFVRQCLYECPKKLYDVEIQKLPIRSKKSIGIGSRE